MSAYEYEPREHHPVSTRRFHAGTLLDVLTEGNTAKVFFKNNTDPAAVEFDENVTEELRFTLGNAPVVFLKDVQAGRPLMVSVAGEKQVVKPRPVQTEAFRNMNVLFAEVNGQPPKAVMMWLQYYVDHHGLEGALLLFRGKSGQLIKEVMRRSKRIKALQRLICLEFDTPLGALDLPPATHPFNCPAAPGKNRMDLPVPDPETSPLAAMQIWEYARHAYLDKAAAVANLDISDYVPPLSGSSLFQEAKTCKGDFLPLAGTLCYPWRTRDQGVPRLADHICRQFDQTSVLPRWCAVPDRIAPHAHWRVRSIPKAQPGITAPLGFYRAMAIRHPGVETGKLAPKSSLIVDDALQALSENLLDYKPVLPPEVKPPKKIRDGSVTLVTCMKNEGPFLLEWLAYHRVIGVTDFFVYTNDCNDGTDTFFDLLQEKGYLQHRENPFREMGLKPQHAAMFAAMKEDAVQTSDWLTHIDVDEFITIKVGDGTLKSLFEALPDMNMISMTWRLFGNGDRDDFKDELTTEAYTMCAPEFCPRPHQAWGFKTLYRNLGIFRKMGVHRPKGLNAQLHDQINWVNGSGKPMPQKDYRNAWRSTTSTWGYDMVSLNHYAVRNCESFLVKRDRGRVNHVERDQGLAYWFRMNNNADEDHSIHRMLPALRKELARLKSDPEIAAAHEYCVRKHREKIDELRSKPANEAFYAELNSPRQQRLSRLHKHFGMNVFLAGPTCVPDEVVERDLPDDFFFTVEKTETQH